MTIRNHSSLDTEELRELLQSLERAFLSGVTSVSFNGETTVFRSLSELLRAINNVKRTLGIPTPNTKQASTARFKRR